MINIKYIPLPNNSVAHKKTSYHMIPEFICIHNTANKATAKGEIDYMHISDDYRSFHFAVDETEIVQGLPLDTNSWHAGDGECGDGNRKGISIEICRSYCPVENGGGDEKLWQTEYKTKFEKAQENAAELTAYILHKYGWGCDLSRVRKHQDFDGKYCPHRTMCDYGWDFFLNLVRKKYEEMYSEDVPMTANEKKLFDALQTKVASLEKILAKYEKQKVYDNAAIRWAYVDGNLPNYATPTVKKLIKKGYLKGNDENSLELSELMLRLLVILDRAKAFEN